jgi:hypothetical protein
MAPKPRIEWYSKDVVECDHKLLEKTVNMAKAAKLKLHDHFTECIAKFKKTANEFTKTELDKAKDELVDHMIRFRDMLDKIEERDDGATITLDATSLADMRDKAVEMERTYEEAWWEARNAVAMVMESRRRAREEGTREERDEDASDEAETTPKKREFKLNYAALKPKTLNERISGQDFSRWKIQSISWYEASGMANASNDTQRILFESIVEKEFLEKMILEIRGEEDDETETATSKTFMACLENAESVYLELQNDFIRRSYFFSLKIEPTELPSAYLRRVIETTRRASLKKMDVDDWSTHQFMSTIPAKLR